MELTYIVLLGEAKELADLGSALGSKALGVDDVGQTGNVLLALLDDGQSKDGQVHADNATADRLALALAGAAGAVAGVAVGEEEADTGRVHDTLLHRETLLVVTAGDAEDVALPLVAEGVSGDLLAHLQITEMLVFLLYKVHLFHCDDCVNNIMRSRRRCNRFHWFGGCSIRGYKRTRFSMKMRSLRSSSISTSFWLPLAG